MEYLVNNMDWIEEQLDDYADDYLIFDCPGQIELYTHYPVMNIFKDNLIKNGYYICGAYLIDSQFVEDGFLFSFFLFIFIFYFLFFVLFFFLFFFLFLFLFLIFLLWKAPKFFSGVLTAMSAMIQLEIPHVNILSKMDLVGGSRSQVEK